MNERLRNKVDELFAGAPRTRRANDLKEELLANLTDKYNDLIAAGKSEDEAYNDVVDGIGDVDELLRGLKESDVFNYEKREKERRKYALTLAVSVSLYILSVVITILGVSVFGDSGVISVCIMLAIIAVATGLIIYATVSRPKYVKEDGSMVEEFKEWKSVHSERNKILQSVKSIMWTLIVVVYLLISFMSGEWGITWIIFIIGAALERIIVLVFQLKE